MAKKKRKVRRKGTVVGSESKEEEVFRRHVKGNIECALGNLLLAVSPGNGKRLKKEYPELYKRVKKVAKHLEKTEEMAIQWFMGAYEPDPMLTRPTSNQKKERKKAKVAQRGDETVEEYQRRRRRERRLARKAKRESEEG